MEGDLYLISAPPKGRDEGGLGLYEEWLNTLKPQEPPIIFFGGSLTMGSASIELDSDAMDLTSSTSSSSI